MSKTAWMRIFPFALFMGFIGLQQGLSWLADRQVLSMSDVQQLYLYPVKAVLVAVLLLLLWRHYDELRWRDLADLRQTLGSILLGLLVFLLWINMDWDFASLGQNQGFDPTLVAAEGQRQLLIAFRIFGAALVVPVMEELFWRSFLLRYIIDSDFEGVAVGSFSWSSFLISAGLFGLEHHLVLAGVMAGLSYNLLLYWTRSVMQCTLAHAVTNFALAVYVLQTGSWQFW